MMILWIYACTESQYKGTAPPQLYFGGITDSPGCTALRSDVSMLSFPTFTLRKQDCKPISTGEDFWKGVWLTASYFAAQKHLSRNAF